MKSDNKEGWADFAGMVRETNSMRIFPFTYDRADVLMSAGCSAFISAALILVAPRAGIVLLEILVGLFLVGCALMARARLRIKARVFLQGTQTSRRKYFDRYDLAMILAVIVIQWLLGGALHRAGVPEAGIRIFPLLLVVAGILVKPYVASLAAGRVLARTRPEQQQEAWWKEYAAELKAKETEKLCQ